MRSHQVREQERSADGRTPLLTRFDGPVARLPTHRLPLRSSYSLHRLRQQSRVHCGHTRATFAKYDQLLSNIARLHGLSRSMSRYAGGCYH